MGKPAARVEDTTSHGSPLTGVGCLTVLIGGKPAWRINDVHTCTIPNAPPPAGTGTPHGPSSNVIPIPDGGDGIVLIDGQSAARQGDIVIEPGANVPLPPPNNIALGELTVQIGMGVRVQGDASPVPERMDTW
jgi:uncharacterized Zn-binding protein involved in type VI secretion